MTKHRRTKRRTQRGGFLGFGESDPNAPSQSWSEWFSGLGSKAKESTTNLVSTANTAVGDLATSASNVVTNVTDSAKEALNTDVPLTGESTTNTTSSTTENPAPITSYGGKHRGKGRRRVRKTMKGGKGGLGLTYYATPVSDIKVVSPTYLEVYANGTNQYNIKGGSRNRRLRKSRRTRRHKRR